MFASPPILIEKALTSGRFSGVAWSFLDTPDREGDAILPSALERAVKSGPRPAILIEHDATQQAGVVDAMAVTSRGLEIEGQLNLSAEIGRKAYQALQERELGALSIGFAGVAERSGSLRMFTEIELREISIVREPMNAGARISAVKSWREVTSARDLERLLHTQTEMPNRLARKAATILWPQLQNDDIAPDDAERVADRIRQFTQSLRS